MRGFRGLLLAVAAAFAAFVLIAATPPGGDPAPPAGPPYPPPVTGQRVYDFADALEPRTEEQAQQTAEAIERRTGAQIVVYTQVKPDATTESTERDAVALIDQWGIGRRGFDDGLVIFYNLDESRIHGEVQLYAAPGFRATFLTNEQRQTIFENGMVPLLRVGDLDGATLAALAGIDRAATPENAQRLQAARQVDALLGLLVAPLAFLLLFGWAAFTWLRFGSDPEYIDDPSIYAAGPPEELTPALASVVLEGYPERRTLTSAILDLASRGEFVFREEPESTQGKVGIQLGGRVDARMKVINSHRPLGKAERTVLEEIRLLGLAEDDRYISPVRLKKLGSEVGTFNDQIETAVVDKGWFTDRPRRVRGRWARRGVLEIVLGLFVLFVARFLPSGGVTLIGFAVIAAGVGTLLLAGAMPARTLAGAMIRAMLAAYRRTLVKTIALSRSLEAAVEEARLPWLEAPDQLLVWGTALGLQGELDALLARAVEDVTSGAVPAGSTYLPAWYAATAGSSGGGSGSGGGLTSPVAGLMSSSAIPNFGGMFAVLGTIGDSLVVTSSGGSGSGSGSSSSSGSFGGGSSGGGGGGAGGGF
jgi:uncharacterized protein